MRPLDIRGRGMGLNSNNRVGGGSLFLRDVFSTDWTRFRPPTTDFLTPKKSVKEFDSAGHIMTTRFLSVFLSWNCIGCPAESDSLLYFFSIKDSTSAENTDFQMRQVLRPNWQSFSNFRKFENLFVMLYWFSARNLCGGQNCSPGSSAYKFMVLRK